MKHERRKLLFTKSLLCACLTAVNVEQSYLTEVERIRLVVVTMEVAVLVVQHAASSLVTKSYKNLQNFQSPECTLYYVKHVDPTFRRNRPEKV